MMKLVSGCTTIPTEECTFTWKIENFSMKPFAVGEKMSSDSFTTGSTYLTTWRLDLYPNGGNENEDDEFIIFLRRKPTGKSNHSVFLSLSLQANDGRLFYSTDSERCIFQHKTNYFGYQITTRSLIESKKHLLLPDDTLTIVCKMRVTGLDDDMHSTLDTQSGSHTIAEANSTLTKDLEVAFENKMHSDFTIKVGDETLYAHKFMLAARSEVFATMLQQDMKEKHTNCIEITDVDSTVVKVMLGYMYTGQLKDITSCEMALQLYHAADKYALLDMKGLCAKYILANLSVENVCDVLQFGKLYEDKEFFNSAKNFIQVNATKVLTTKKWNGLLGAKPELAYQIMHQIVLEK